MRPPLTRTHLPLPVCIHLPPTHVYPPERLDPVNLSSDEAAEATSSDWPDACLAKVRLGLGGFMVRAGVSVRVRAGVRVVATKAALSDWPDAC